MSDVAERLRAVPGPVFKLDRDSGIAIACVEGGDTLRMVSSSEEPGVLTLSGFKAGHTYVLTHEPGAMGLLPAPPPMRPVRPATVPRFHRHRWTTWQGGEGLRQHYVDGIAVGDSAWVQIQTKTCTVCNVARVRQM